VSGGDDKRTSPATYSLETFCPFHLRESKLFLILATVEISFSCSGFRSWGWSLNEERM
jgi:hypothetical protein